MTQDAPPPLRIGLAGLGTVGCGVVRLLAANAALVAARGGRPIVVTAVSARDRARPRGVDLAGVAWEANMTALAGRDDVDVVVELVGGAEGPARALADAGLALGKPLVTANKAMIAHHGVALAALAMASGAALRFEAAVAGGIPVIKGLREGAAANRISRISGILNGTCNYILSAMAASGADFASVLTDAQAKGYAEADPAFDIEGIDAAHKLAILAAVGFGTAIDFAAVETAGIGGVLAADIAEARGLGYVIRLVGIAEDGPDGLFQRVGPHLVPLTSPLAHVVGATNAVVIEGDFVGRLLFEGAGAGAGPTASAVVADLIDLARHGAGPDDHPFGVPAGALRTATPADAGGRRGRAYLRFLVADRTGVLAEITAAMRDAGVSIESLIQRGHEDLAESAEGPVLVAMVTHDGPEAAVRAAVARLAGSRALAVPPLIMPILAT